MTFDRGTLRISGIDASDWPHVVWDARVGAYRGTAMRYGVLRALCAAHGVEDALEPTLSIPIEPVRAPEKLRSYQEEAVAAWEAAGRQGLVVLPTGAGKTRIAIAAMSRVNVPTLILCPTRVLLEAWVQQLEQVHGGPIGIVGDGAHHVEDITVMTFESAYRHLDRWGGRFAMLVIDEAHHFGTGVRTEALEMCAAPMRLGLTATAPPERTPAHARRTELIGKIVFEMRLDQLVGTHLAPLEIVHVRVSFEDDEWTDYVRLYGPFAELRAAFARAYPEADWADCVRAITRTERGRKAYADYNRAIALAAFPKAKQRLVASLVERHRKDKTLVFSGLVEHAYRIAEESFVPIITADVGRQEREAVLAKFAAGDVRCIVSARVLNEGVDVPDANVAIVVSGMLGEREHIQRIGRVLRPSPGKRALVYELATRSTIDEKRAQNRRRTLAAQRASRFHIERATG